MAFFIKTGFWKEAVKGLKEELNLNQLILSISGGGGGGTWGSIIGTLSNQTDLQTALDTKNDSIISVDTQTNDYTLALTDINKVIDMNKATSISLIIPPNSSIPIPVGSLFYPRRIGIGALTFVQGSGVTVTPTSGYLVDPAVNIMMTLRKTGTDTWDLQNGLPNYKTLLIGGDVSTTLGTAVNATGFAWALEASTSYRISGCLLLGCSSTGGVKLFGTFPTSSTFYVHTIGQLNTATAISVSAFNSSGNVPSAAYVTTGSSGRVFLDGYVTTSSTSGTFQLQFLAGVAGQTATVFQLGSVIKVEKI